MGRGGTGDLVRAATSVAPALDPADQAAADPRVAAVLDVLAGRSLPDAADAHHLDPADLERWVASFVEAGAACVANRAEPDAAAVRDRLLADVAHELRTPLTAVSGWADQVVPEQRGDTRALDHLRRSLVRLTDRLEDLELLGAATTGRLPLDRRLVRLGDLVEGLGIGSIGGDGPDVVLHVDPTHFRRIVHDLWEASGVRPAPSSRSLVVSVIDPWIQLSVVRQGSPLSHDALRAMFDPFEHDGDDPGAAVGLYLARALTVAHSGTLGVSPDERRTVFWVRTPAAPPPDPL